MMTTTPLVGMWLAGMNTRSLSPGSWLSVNWCRLPRRWGRPFNRALSDGSSCSYGASFLSFRHRRELRSRRRRSNTRYSGVGDWGRMRPPFGQVLSALSGRATFFFRSAGFSADVCCVSRRPPPPQPTHAGDIGGRLVTVPWALFFVRVLSDLWGTATRSPLRSRPWRRLLLRQTLRFIEAAGFVCGGPSTFCVSPCSNEGSSLPPLKRPLCLSSPEFSSLSSSHSSQPVPFFLTDECNAAPAWPAWGRAGVVRGHRMATFSVSNELQLSYPEPSVLSIATPPEVPTLSFPDTVPPVGRAACRKKPKCQLHPTQSLSLRAKPSLTRF